MKLQLKENDFKVLTKNLIDNEPLLKFFKSYGISIETLRILMIGCDEEGNVVCPIFNHRNVIQGALTIFNIYVDGGVYRFDTYGMIGNPKSEDKSITIAKNLIDVCLLWQLGVDNPIMLSDSEETPYMHNYKSFTFVDPSNDLINSLVGSIYSYNIKDLVNYLSMHKVLPIPEKVLENEDRIKIEKLPMIIDNKVYIHTSQRGNVLDSEGRYLVSIKVDDKRRTFKVGDTVFYFYNSAYFVDKSYKFNKKKEDLSMLLEDVFNICYGHLTFMSQDQCMILAMYILYIWLVSYRHPLKTHLHVLNPSPLQQDIMFNFIRRLMPSMRSNFDCSSIIYKKDNQRIFFHYPYIFLDLCSSTGSYDIGSKILVTEDSCDLREKKSKRIKIADMMVVRNRLINQTLVNTFKLRDDLSFGVYTYYMPFYQIGMECGIDEQEIKRLFNVVVMSSQRKFKTLDIQEYIRTHTTKLDQDSINYFEPSVPSECTS